MPKIIVTEEQWIQKGIERFEQGGIEQLVIEKMVSRFLRMQQEQFLLVF